MSHSFKLRIVELVKPYLTILPVGYRLAAYMTPSNEAEEIQSHVFIGETLTPVRLSPDMYKLAEDQQRAPCKLTEDFGSKLNLHNCYMNMPLSVGTNNFILFYKGQEIGHVASYLISPSHHLHKDHESQELWRSKVNEIRATFKLDYFDPPTTLASINKALLQYLTTPECRLMDFEHYFKLHVSQHMFSANKNPFVVKHHLEWVYREKAQAYLSRQMRLREDKTQGKGI